MYNIILNSMIRLSSGVFVYVGNLVLSNKYTTEVVGEYFYLFSFIPIIVALSLFGNDKLLLREMSKLNGIGSLGNIFFIVKKITISSMISCLIVAVFFFLGIIKENGLTYWLLVFLTIINSYFASVLIADERNKLVQFSVLIQCSMFTLLIFLLNNYYVHADANFILNLYSLSLATSIVFMFFFMAIAYKKNEINLIEYRFLDGKYLLLSTVAQSLAASLPIWVIGYYSDEKNIAFYAVISKSAFVINIVIAMIDANYSRVFSKKYSEGKLLELALIVKQASRMMLFVNGPLIFVLIIFSKLYLSFFGEQYAQQYEVLIVYLVGLGINVSTGNAGYLLIMTGNEKIFKNINIQGLIIYFMMLMITTKSYGALGGAVSYVVYSFYVNITSYYQTKEKLKISTLPL